MASLAAPVRFSLCAANKKNRPPRGLVNLKKSQNVVLRLTRHPFWEHSKSRHLFWEHLSPRLTLKLTSSLNEVVTYVPLANTRTQERYVQLNR